MRRLILAVFLPVALAACGSAADPQDQPSILSLTTSRDDLSSVVTVMTTRLADSPTDSDAAVRLADAWLRQARILNRGSLHLRAEEVLDRVIDASPSDYLARRMRATVYLAQHRFQDALLEAGRCRVLRSHDPVIDGIEGDARLELGDLPAAIEAYDRMLAQRPDAASYARASYARELQGDIPGALRLMQMAGEATSAHDVESQAWHAAQLGNLHLRNGDHESAALQFSRADALFPGHPFAVIGLARIDLAEGRPHEALARLQPRLDAAPSADDFRLAGDVLLKLDQPTEARRHHALAAALAIEEQRVVPPGGTR